MFSLASLVLQPFVQINVLLNNDLMQLLLCGDTNILSGVKKNFLELTLNFIKKKVALAKKDSSFCLIPDCQKSHYSSSLPCGFISCWVLGKMDRNSTLV